MSERAYLDWNATAPLRPEAREAMLRALDRLGNPSSVHAEGRAARAIVERARGQVARLVDCEPHQVVFTSGATEANNIALQSRSAVCCAAVEHASVLEAVENGVLCDRILDVDEHGRVDRESPALRGEFAVEAGPGRRAVAVAAANGETGVIDDAAAVFALAAQAGLAGHCDASQAAGRVPFSFRRMGAATAALSAHKLGGPQGVGALLHDDVRRPEPLVWGGGQEDGWRAGTINVAGVAGFGAAAEAAARELEAGAWDRVLRLRNILEERLFASAPDAILIGGGCDRLPNTSCVVAPGWRAETQVMQLDLAGFAVSAGAACSSGKVAASRALLALGLDEAMASCAIRISLGPTTTQDEIDGFCATWARFYDQRRDRAA